MKVNEVEFSTFKTTIEQKFVKLTDNYKDQIDRMLNNENYVEKYIPIYNQRMITEALEHVLKKK